MDGTAFFRPLVPDDIRQIAVMALSELVWSIERTFLTETAVTYGSLL